MDWRLQEYICSLLFSKTGRVTVSRLDPLKPKSRCTRNSDNNDGVNIYKQVFLFTYIRVMLHNCLQGKLLNQKNDCWFGCKAKASVNRKVIITVYDGRLLINISLAPNTGTAVQDTVVFIVLLIVLYTSAVLTLSELSW